MRIFLIIDETCFYQPDFVASLIRQATDDCFVGAALVTKVSPKNNIETYLRRHWYLLNPTELIKLVYKKLLFTLKDIFSFMNCNRNGYYSVRSVLNTFKIPFFEVKNNINEDMYLLRIRAFKPDIIISSNSLYFGPELLDIPIHCINRHSGLLPSYGGLLPVFQALRKGEYKTGVSIHQMTGKIDGGNVIAKEEIIILPSDTVDTLYQKCFAISPKITLEALSIIKNNPNNIPPLQNIYPFSYYSFPIKSHWKEFRKRGRDFI